MLGESSNAAYNHVRGCLDTNGWCPLHNACYNKQEEIVKILLENKADVNAFTKRKNTALQFAARINAMPRHPAYQSEVSALLFGAPPTPVLDSRECDCWRPLPQMRVATNIGKQLLASGARVDGPGPPGRLSTLSFSTVNP